MTGLSKDQLEILKPGSTARPEIPEGMFAQQRTPQDAIELAYGFLWSVGVDKTTREGQLISLARKTLLDQIDRDGQARGITAARAAVL